MKKVKHYKLQAEAYSHLENLTLRQLMLMIAIAHLEPDEKNTIKSNWYFLNLFKGFNKEEIAMFRTTLEKLADYDHIGQKHFEKQVKIDIGKDSKDMEKFLEQVRKEIL